MTKDNYKELEKWMSEVDRKLDNHLIHSAADIAQIKNDIDWFKRSYWAVAGTSIAAIISTAITFIFK